MANNQTHLAVKLLSAYSEHQKTQGGYSSSEGTTFAVSVLLSLQVISEVGVPSECGLPYIQSLLPLRKFT